MLEGVGRIRVGDDTLTVPRYGGAFVGPTAIHEIPDAQNEKREALERLSAQLEAAIKAR